MRDPRRIAAYLWAAPTTAFGLFWGGFTLLTGGRARIVEGVVEFHGGFADFYLRRVGFGAITLGHAILARDAARLDLHREHEHVHVRQVERWGPFFLLAYLIASAWVWARGGRAYRDNPFEREAFDLTSSERANGARP
jgi:hypothetical protein